MTETSIAALIADDQFEAAVRQFSEYDASPTKDQLLLAMLHQAYAHGRSRGIDEIHAIYRKDI